MFGPPDNAIFDKTQLKPGTIYVCGFIHTWCNPGDTPKSEVQYGQTVFYGEDGQFYVAEGECPLEVDHGAPLADFWV